MKTDTWIGKGSIDASGVVVVDWVNFKPFTNRWPDRQVLVTLEVIPEDTSRALQGYYFGYIIPQLVNAYREVVGEFYTKEELDRKLRGMCPLMIKEVPTDAGFELARKLTFKEAGNAKALAFIEWVQQHAIQEFNLTFNQ